MGPLWDRLAIGDVDRSRLRLGLAAALSAAGNTALLFWLARLLRLPASDALIGVVIGMMSAVLVRDNDLPSQRRTHALLVLPALGSAALAALAATSALLSQALFLILVFVAVYVRRFGARATALGTMAFIAYFDAVFFKNTARGLPWLAASIVFGVGVAFLVRFVLMRDTPFVTLERTLSALPRVTRLLLRAVEPLRAAPEQSAKSQRRVRWALARLSELALAIGEQSAGLAERQRFGLRLAVLDLELALNEAAARERALFERPRKAVQRIDVDVDVDAALARVAAAAAALRERDFLPPARSDAMLAASSSAEAARATAEGGTSLHQALQALVACALAIAGGQRLSPDRWYWAVITAFVVFNQAQTLSDTVRRAWHRILGTVAGVICGSFLVLAVAGQRPLELALVFACIFCGFYLLRVSYAWMVFWITTLLGLLYALLGRDTHGLLQLRVTETLVGAAAGVCGAALVFPARTAALVRAKLLDLLGKVEAFLRAAPACHARPNEWLEHGLRLEGALRELSAVALPYVDNRFGPGQRFGELMDAARLLVLLLRECAPTDVAESAQSDAASPQRSALLQQVQRMMSRAMSGEAAAEAHATSELGEPAAPPSNQTLARIAQALRDLDAAAEAWYAT